MSNLCKAVRPVIWMRRGCPFPRNRTKPSDYYRQMRYKNVLVFLYSIRTRSHLSTVTLTPSSFSILRANYRNAPHSQSLAAIRRKQCAKPCTTHFLLLHTLPAQDTCAVMRRITCGIPLVSPRQIEPVSLTLSSAAYTEPISIGATAPITPRKSACDLEHSYSG